MKTIPRCLVLFLALAWLGSGGAARAQSSVYTANSTAATVEPGAVHFLQLITLGQGPGTYAITKLVYSANFTTSDPQRIIFYFYTGVDTDPASTDALAHATVIAVQSGDYQPDVGNFAFIINYDTPFLLTTDGTGTVGVEVYLATPDSVDPSTSTFSTTANGRFTDSVPTVGFSPGYTWNDADLDRVFTGAEQTRFGMANANYRMSMSGSLFPVVKTYARNGTTATLTVDSDSGFNYQLQRATSLAAGNWTNVGSAVAGSNGTTLTFTDADTADPQAFYRVTAALPPMAVSRVASMKKTPLVIHPRRIARPD